MKFIPKLMYSNGTLNYIGIRFTYCTGERKKKRLFLKYVLRFCILTNDIPEFVDEFVYSNEFVTRC